MATVVVTRYNNDKHDIAETVGEYEDINCIMTLGTKRSEGIAFVSLGDPVSLSIEEGFEVEVNDDFLDVKPIK